MTIKVLIPKVPKLGRLLPYLKEIDDNRWYTNFGPLVRKLESRLSERYKGAHVVTTSNGTSALQIALLWERENGKDTACWPALTFPAAPLASLAAGLKVVLDDCDPRTWTNGYVANFGLPGWGPGLIDAAGAFGEQTVPKGMTATFSLHATKVLGAGEGGFIVTHDKYAADFYRRMTNFGILPMTTGVSEGPGTNAKLSEYHAAVALAALDCYDPEPWLRLHDWYAKSLPACVAQQKRPRGVYSLMPVKLPIPADIVQERMKAQGIETRRWYWPPLYRHPIFKGPVLPVSEDLSTRLLGLPYHLFLQKKEVEQVCESLGRAIA